MSRRLLGSSLVQVLLLAAACSNGDQAVTPPSGTSPVTISVSPGLQPDFSWTPAVPIAALEVARPGSGSIIWSTISVNQRDAIAPTVRYGVFPAGAALTANILLPLVEGTTYRVAVFRIDPAQSNSLVEAGHAFFTP